MNLAPIVLFVYNRPWHTRQTIKALQNCELAAESDLYVFADGPKEIATDETRQKISEVRQYIHTIDGFRSIHIQESPTNKGLANSVIQGVSEIINKRRKVIVLEDDILTHPFFLQFMNDALDYYCEDNRIFSIGAFMDDISIPDDYAHDVFVCRRVETWGWGTWADRWISAEWDMSKYPIFKHTTNRQIRHLCRGGDDLWTLLQMQAAGKIDSWAARWQYNLTLRDGYCLRPKHSLVNNIGMDGSGTHCGNVINNSELRASRTEYSSIWESAYLLSTPIFSHTNYDIQMVSGIKEDKSIVSEIQHHFKQAKDSTWKRVKRFIKHSLHHAISFCHHALLQGETYVDTNAT